MVRPHVLLSEEQAVSNTLGIALLIAITVSLVTVVGVIFVGFGQQERVESPTVVVEVNADPGPDGTFSDAGDGGICAGDTYDDDDKVEIEFLSGDVLRKDAVEFRVGSSNASMAPCAGGRAELDYLTTVPDEITAGTSVTIAEGNGNNAIRSGADVRVIWFSPETDQSFVLHQSTIGG